MTEKSPLRAAGKAPLSVWHIVSEVAPFSRTGGLGDVAAAMPGAQAALGMDVHLISPFYRGVEQSGASLRRLEGPGGVDFRGHRLKSEIYASTRESGWTAYFVRREEFFDRAGLYGGRMGDFFDNADRFAYFVQAALSFMMSRRRPPDIIHCHDWQTALAPVFLKQVPRFRDFFQATRTVLTIHNMAFQGDFPEDALAAAGLPRELFHWKGLEYFGRVNYLKGGLLFADRITTVSPRYSREILTAEFGEGLEGVLRERRHRIKGILNGVDQSRWDPRTDPVLPANYGPSDLSGKSVCRGDLLRRLGLKAAPGTPVIGMVTRLAEQKGIDLVIEGLEALLRLGVVLVVLGSGDEAYQQKLVNLRDRFSDRFSLTLAFDDDLAHRIEAGADFFLMPSRFEPCGLNQMYSLRYGTIPVVRAVGGLENSVREFDPVTGLGNGFKFTEYSTRAMLAAVRRALEVTADPVLKNRIRVNGMRADFSWKRAARAYLRLYRKTLSEDGGRRPGEGGG